MPILDHGFNGVVKYIGNLIPQRFTATSFKTLSELSAEYANHGKVPVNTEHCTRTVFGDPSVCFAFRAWYNNVHITLAQDFDIKGEIAVCREMEAQVDKLQGIDQAYKDFYKTILHSIIVEEALYKYITHSPIEDENYFVANSLFMIFNLVMSSGKTYPESLEALKELAIGQAALANFVDSEVL